MIKLFLIVISLFGKLQCSDVVLKLNPKRSTRSINENFISLSIGSPAILNGFFSRLMSNETEMLESLSPGYLKIDVEPELLHNLTPADLETGQRFGVKELQVINEWSSMKGFQNIIQLNYESGSWKPKNHLQLFGMANDFGVTNCTWQFGEAISQRSVKQYIGDFKVLNQIVGMSSSNGGFSLLSAPFSQNLSVEKAEIVNRGIKDIVESVIYKRSVDDFITTEQFLKDTTLKYLLKTNKKVWLQPTFTEEHSKDSITDALAWAQLIGEAAKTGFNSIFKPLEKIDLIRPHFKHLISFLFKQLVGTKVLNLVSFRGQPALKPYAFCSKEPGSVVMMLVNSGSDKISIQLKKMISKRKGKGPIYEYVVSACDGKVCLNQSKPQLKLEPIELRGDLKSIKVPASSVAFYVFPEANFPVCRQEKRTSSKSSEEDLNKDLTSGNFNKIQAMLREKRSLKKETAPLDISGLDSLPFGTQGFHLRDLRSKAARERRGRRHLPRLPELNFFNPKRLGGYTDRTVKPKPVKTRIPGIETFGSSVEDKVFQSSENEDLPLGEIHLDLSRGTNEEEPDYDYVQFDTTPAPKRKASKKKNRNQKTEDLNFRVEREEQDTDDDLTGVDFGQEFGSRKGVQPEEKLEDDVQLDIRRTKQRKVSRFLSKIPKEKVKYAHLVKEVAPTTRQNQENVKKAHKKIELLQTGDTEVNVRSDEELIQEDNADYYHEDNEKLSKSNEESDLKTKRHSNRVEQDEEELQDERFIGAFARLLRKMEEVFAEESSSQEESGSRRRREVSSVHVPRRRMRKDIALKAQKTKNVSKVKPLDINSVASQNFVRAKRSLILPPQEIENLFYEIENNDRSNQIEFVMQPEPSLIYAWETSTVQDTSTTEESSLQDDLVKVNDSKSFRLFHTGVINAFVTPFFDIFSKVKDSSLKYLLQLI